MDTFDTNVWYFWKATGLNTNEGSIRSIAWNPLGTLIATGSADRTLRVWNPERPSIRFSTDLKGHSAGIERVAWNPMKEAELCSVSSDGVVKFWDVKNKTCTNEVKGLGDAITMAWCPDGETLVVGNKASKLLLCVVVYSSCLYQTGRQHFHTFTNIAYPNYIPPAANSDQPNGLLLERQKDISVNW